MSYRPPTKSSYDDELTEDGWSSTYSQTHQPGSSGYQATPANYNRTQNANNSNTTSPQSKNSFQDDPANLGSSITQEDILFMRSWQKDSFVKRGKSDGSRTMKEPLRWFLIFQLSSSHPIVSCQLGRSIYVQ